MTDIEAATQQIEFIIQALNEGTFPETITKEQVNEALGFMTILHMQLNDPERLAKAIKIKEFKDGQTETN